MRTTTRCAHAGREGFKGAGVHAPPLDRSSTYPLTDLYDGSLALAELADGASTASSPVYSRLHNPTTARWEGAVASLEGAAAGVAFASGMAAITGVLIAAGAIGAHVVAVRPLYGGTDHLLSSGLLGIDVTWAAPDGVAAAIRPDTRLVLLETPANPTLHLVDIADVVAQAGAVPVAVDNTFATPVLQQPMAFGASYVMHSATKFLSGHGDVLAGIAVCAEQLARPLRQVRILTGAVLDPQAAWLLHRSLPTLPMRVRTAQEGATALAARLQGHPLVTAVHHPSLDDPAGLVGRQMTGPGAVLAFDVDTQDRAAAVMKSVRLMTPAVSLGSTDTLIQHPASLTHLLVEEGARDEHGVSAGLLRISVGVEDIEDLWADLSQALDAA